MLTEEQNHLNGSRDSGEERVWKGRKKMIGIFRKIDLSIFALFAIALVIVVVTEVSMIAKS